MADRLFIAHASSDASLATALKQFVEDVFTGADVFLAEDGIRGGAGWFERIREALAVEPVILALVTPNSIGSPWLYFEAGSGFVEKRSIPVCGAGTGIEDLASPFSDLHARELSTPETVAELAWDLASAWGHKRRPDEELLRRLGANLLTLSAEMAAHVRPAGPPTSGPPDGDGGADEDEEDNEAWGPVDRQADLARAAQLALDLDYQAKNWEQVTRLFSTNGRSLVRLLQDVYGYTPPPEADWDRRQDDVLRDELRHLPTEVHRIIVESHWGVWYEPIPDYLVAAALRLTPRAHEQKLTTATSMMRERKEQALHEFRKQFEWEYREFR